MENKPVGVTDEQYEFADETPREGTQLRELGEVILVSTAGVRRIPVPTADPNDPLNWPTWKKAAVVATCCWFSLFALLNLGGLGTFFNTLFELYGATHSPTEIVGLSTYPSMVAIFGCLILLPLSLVFGRRPVFLGASILLLICTLTAGSSKTFDAHLISRIFSGIAAGATESLLPLIIADLTFLDERNFYFGLYWSTQSCLNAALLVALSYLTAAEGWRWYYWFFAIVVGFSIICVFFFAPETRFMRSPQSINGEVIYTDEFGETHIISDAEARERLGTVQEFTVTLNPEKRSFWQELQPWSSLTPNSVPVLLGAYGKIFRAFTSPAVIYALLVTSISLGVAIAVTLIYSTLLIDSYGWAPKSVGLFNIGIIPACFCAMFYAGFCADKINVWLAKRNNGIHKSEHHLIHLIPSFIAGIIGIVTIAVCANDPKTHSVWGLLVGWAIYEFSFTSIIITSTAFAAEVIPESPGAAIVVVVGGKNLVSFGASQGIVPMVAKYSYLKSFMILLGIYIGIAVLGIPVYYLNAKWRRVMKKYKRNA